MTKSNIRYKSNLYVLKTDSRETDSEFLSKIFDSKLLNQLKKRIGDGFFSEVQKQIAAENIECSLMDKKDNCRGKKGDEYICLCVNADCKDLNKCRKNRPLTKDEYVSFAPELYSMPDYEYKGLCSDIEYFECENPENEAVIKLGDDNFIDFNKEDVKEVKEVKEVEEVENELPEDNEDEFDNQPEDEEKISFIEVEPVNDGTATELLLLSDDEENQRDEDVEDIDEDEDEVKDEENEDETSEVIVENTFETKPYSEEFANETDAQFQKFKVVSQNDIATADASESFLVNAGPGTGKTYTIIQKIYNLVRKQDFLGGEILALSFTHAAVNEIKKRLNLLAKETGKRTLRNTKIWTFDHFAWRINQTALEYPEFAIKYKKQGIFSYESSRKFAGDFLDVHPEVLKDKEVNLGISYFITDEVQDLTDDLAVFVLKVINACKKENIPFSLFGDSCQAIYDYEKRGFKKRRFQKNKMSSSEFYENVFKLYDDRENFVQITENRRQQGKIADLALKYRGDILALNYPSLEKSLENLEENTEKYNSAFPDDCKYPTRCFLTRTNGQSLRYGAKFRKKGIAVRVNASSETDKNVKFKFHPWISEVLSACGGNNLTYEKFKNIVKNNNIALPLDSLPLEEGDDAISEFWNHLLYVSNNDYDIEIERFLSDLSGAKFNDPVLIDNFAPHIEVSTVHKAKGREFDEVLIDEKFYSDLLKAKDKSLCEHKIMYVALTRPKYAVNFVDSSEKTNVKKEQYFKRLRKKITRWHVKKYKHLSHIEIRDKDIDIASFWQDDEIQNVIRKIKLNDEIRLLRKITSGKVMYEIFYRCDKDLKDYSIGKMSDSFVDEMRILGEITSNSGMPELIKGLYVDSVYTYIDASTGKNIPRTAISFCGLGHLNYYTY